METTVSAVLSGASLTQQQSEPERNSDEMLV